MATPAVSAVVRAYKPTFQSPHDKVAFAIHGVLSVSGFTLLATGPATDAKGDEVRHGTEEAPLDGWNATASEDQGGYYTFMYRPPQSAISSTEATPGKSATPAVLLCKAVVMGAQLMVSFCMDPCPPDQPPDSLELDVHTYAGERFTAEGAYTYTHLEQLVQQVQDVVNKQVPQARKATHSSAATTDAAQQGGSRNTQPVQPRPDDVDPLRDYSHPARAPRNPLAVGGGDLHPGMLPGRHGFDPLEGALPGLGGGGLGPAGGMLMGPNHPAFGVQGPGRVGPQPGPGMGGPGPGMRWDPIAPPGLPGFNPGDFRPGGPGRGGPDNIDPDIMQPGRGRGTDWDQMFG